MQSITRAVPVDVSNVVSSTSVSPRYLRLPVAALSTGAIRHRPWSAVPSNAAKQAPESNRGRHNQSIDPSRLTNATVCVSPMTA